MKSKNLLVIVIILYCQILFAQNSDIQNLLDSISIDNIKSHVDSLVWAGGHETRSSYTEGNKEAAEYIYNYLLSIPELIDVKMDTFYIPEATSPYDTIPQVNVVAYLPGKTDDPEIIIVGGHYDASGSRGNNYDETWNTTYKARGADDNATGVAGTLEIARILSDPTISFNNQHTIKFIAFAAEEYHPVHPSVHHAGSMYDAKKTMDNEEPLSAAIILDMIGYNYEYNYIEVISDNQSLWLADEMYNSRNQYVPELLANASPANVPYSDHQSYQIYGFPAILLMENDKPWSDDSPYYLKNPYYHRNLDRIETVNFEQVEMVTKVSLAATATLALRNDPTTSIDFAEQTPEEFSLTAYPNPFNGQVNIKFSLYKSTTLDISFYNALGQEIESMYSNSMFQVGTHNIQWTTDSKSSGLYFCIIRGDFGIKSQKLVLLK